MRRLIAGCLIAFFVMPCAQSHAQSCCGSGRSFSLIDVFLDAEMIVVGRFQNSVEPNNALPYGQVELVFDRILQTHDSIKEKKSIILGRHIKSKAQFLVGMELDNGKIEPYRAVAVDAEGEVERFVRGALALRDRSQLARMRFAVDFLHSPCEEVADSARIEIERASYADLRKVAEKMKAGPLVKALQNSKTSRDQCRTFAMLLGHCGTKQDATILRKMIDHCAHNENEILPGYLLVYVLLEPAEGWQYVTKLSVDRKQSFLHRFAALGTIRQLAEDRPDIHDLKKCSAAMANILEVPDIADRAVEDLRKWKRWEHCDAILAMHGKAAYDKAYMRRAILRFALECPTPAAKTFVTVERSKDSQWVADTEELLAIEKGDVVGPKK
jgi:hypothetical protein